MKAKTIKSVLSRKHNALLKSLDDNEEIKNLINNKTIVTGGSIASMLLNEKVSDFDYYFTTQEAARKVAHYYLNKFIARHYPQNPPDAHIDINEDGRVTIKIKSVGVLSEKKVKNDPDAMMPESELEEINTETVGLDGDTEPGELIEGRFRPVFLSSNAITLSNKVQLIIRFYGEPEDIHKNYDFEHCKCWWRPKTGELHLPDKALLCLLNKELVYTGSRYPLCSIIRTRKFINRGWQINAGQYVKMALQLNNLDLLDPDVLEDQLTGVDVVYFLQVIDNIRNMMVDDPEFLPSAEYLTFIIDKIFD